MVTWRAKKELRPYRLRKAFVSKSRKQSWTFRFNYPITSSVVFTNMTTQAFAGLNQTGFVDAKTQEMMDTPR